MFAILGSIVIIHFFGLKYINFSWLIVPISKETNWGKFIATILWNTSGSLLYLNFLQPNNLYM